MSARWPEAPLGEVLAQFKDYINEPEPREYPKLSVRLYGRGVTLDTPADGSILKMKRHQVARAGQVILSEIWGKKGAIGFVPPEGHGALCTSHFFLFDVVRERLEPGWLRALFRSNHLATQLEARAFGTTGYAAVRPDDLLSCMIPLPPLPEQRRIVAKIEQLAAKVEEARTLKEHAVRQLDALIPSVVTRIDQNLRKLHPPLRLEDLAPRERGAFRSGPFGSALPHSDFVDEGVLAVGIQNVQENRFELVRRWNVTPARAQELQRYAVKPRDLLVTVMGTLGRACVVPDNAPPMISTKHVWAVTLDPRRAEPRWVSCWLNFSAVVREELLGQGTGTAIAGLNGLKIRSISLPSIPLSRQQQILAHLDALQALTDALKRLAAETAVEVDLMMPAMFDRAFKGEL